MAYGLSPIGAHYYGAGATRTIISRAGPIMPLPSRTRAATVVSPSGNAQARAIGMQNWAVLREDTVPMSPDGTSLVQAAPALRPAGAPKASSARQPRSLI